MYEAALLSTISSAVERPKLVHGFIRFLLEYRGT
jgi:hypothetical protein